MAWRDQYRPASFRGVPFHARQAGHSGGRRTVQHEYPGRDLPWAEDLGRRARTYPVEGYVIGTDYMVARDALIEALEAEGAGELMHPYHGARQVVVDTFNIREGSRDGGLALFSITFLEAGERSHPAGRRDQVTAIDQQATALTDTSIKDFVSAYSVGGLPAFVALAAEVLLGDLVGTVRDVADGIASTVDQAARFARDLRSLSDEAAELVQSPGSLAERVVGVIEDLGRRGRSRPASGTVALQRLSDWGQGVPAVPRTTATRAQQDDNRQALADLVQRVATAQAATLAVRTEWPTHDEAVSARDALADRLDAVMERTASDYVYLEAQALRADLVQAVPPPDQSLARLSRFTPRATQPALVLAYRLYGDARRADEIVSRNDIRHPGFVIGGDPLEILND
ncbi:DNA circularization N-terminal domain-containing protein [Halomonas sp. H33-56]|uniref:DNA circularization protein n=1 Tax=Halomonas sp. H33-56 TaxID=2950873 RepID=UPI0032DF30A1